jgi:membrane-associated protein
LEPLKQLVDLFLHLDVHLGEMIARFGSWSYAILFAIIFCETGLVVTPFLPGDSLLFGAGSLAGLGALRVGILIPLLSAASTLGDSTNYWIGRYIGPRAFSGSVRFLRKEYLDRTREFYDRHGRKTVILARFLPIIRTFSPFVAGVGQMPYGRFLAFSVTGSLAWVSLFVGAGFLFGRTPFVRDHFSVVVMGIIAVSLLPMGIEVLRNLWADRPK